MSGEPARVIMPIIAVDSVQHVEDFYTRLLGFTRTMGVAGPDGQLGMATVVLDGARIMFSRPRAGADPVRRPAEKHAVEIYLEVADVEAYHVKLQQRGIDICDPLTLQWWGDRTFKIRDPNGYELWFYQKVGAPRPPQGVKLV